MNDYNEDLITFVLELEFDIDLDILKSSFEQIKGWQLFKKRR